MESGETELRLGAPAIIKHRWPKKTLYTLNIGNYVPEITAMTYPLLRHLAERMRAEFVVITERKWPDWPVVYEKLQIYELAAKRGDEWSMFLDSDALTHPETVDFTNFLAPDTVAHNGTDHAAVRWVYDQYFKRDGRNIGSCNWCAIASEWCRDLWQPLVDLTLEEAVANIFPAVSETTSVIERSHLIDDYVLSRNIARFGLKVRTLIALQSDIGMSMANFFWHAYDIPLEEKVQQMRKVLGLWKAEEYLHRLQRGGR